MGQPTIFPPAQGHRPGVGVGNSTLFLVVAAAIIGYFLHLATPLRLNNDSVRLLSMAVSGWEGKGFIIEGRTEVFPSGYPRIVCAMLAAGAANSATLVGLNIVCLAAGLVAAWPWLAGVGGRRFALCVALGVTLSWVTIKHVAIPLSEFVFFALSWAGLFMAGRFLASATGAKWGWLAGAVVAAFLAMECRRIGVVLLPVLLVLVPMHPEFREWRSHPNRSRFLKWVGGLGVALLLVGALLWSAIAEPAGDTGPGGVKSYGQIIGESVRVDRLPAVLAGSAGHRAREFGEIFANIPARRSPGVPALFSILGCAVIGGIAYGSVGLIRAGGSLPQVLYLWFYFGAMMLWNYPDTRFWLPVLPVLGASVAHALTALCGRPVTLTRVWFAGYVILGLVALGFGAKISLSGDKFGEIYGAGSMRMTYRLAFGASDPVDIAQVDPAAARLLQIFEKRAIPPAGGR